MALTPCKECKKEISNETKTCPNCGKKNPSGTHIGCLPSIVILSVFIAFLGLLGSFATPSSKSDSQSTVYVADPSLQKEIDSSVKAFQILGLVMKLTPEYHQVHVNPQAWNQFTVDHKEKTAFIFAKYCEIHSEHHGNWVSVKDGYTNKELASYSATWGFKIK